MARRSTHFGIYCCLTSVSGICSSTFISLPLSATWIISSSPLPTSLGAFTLRPRSYMTSAALPRSLFPSLPRVTTLPARAHQTPLDYLAQRLFLRRVGLLDHHKGSMFPGLRRRRDVLHKLLRGRDCLLACQKKRSYVS